MAFELPQLGYAHDALEPHIDAPAAHNSPFVFKYLNVVDFCSLSQFFEFSPPCGYDFSDFNGQHIG